MQDRPAANPKEIRPWNRSIGWAFACLPSFQLHPLAPSRVSEIALEDRGRTSANPGGGAGSSEAPIDSLPPTNHLLPVHKDVRFCPNGPPGRTDAWGLEGKSVVPTDLPARCRKLQIALKCQRDSEHSAKVRRDAGKGPIQDEIWKLTHVDLKAVANVLDAQVE